METKVILSNLNLESQTDKKVMRIDLKGLTGPNLNLITLNADVF